MNKLLLFSLIGVIALIQADSADDQAFNDLANLSSDEASSFLESLQKRFFSSKPKLSKEEKARQREAENEVNKKNKRKTRMAKAYKLYEDTCETQKNIAQRSCLNVDVCQMHGQPITKAGFPPINSGSSRGSTRRTSGKDTPPTYRSSFRFPSRNK
ncbi:hypothetical protein SNEBB_005090 [Seison nebaliae]|nr:hypothetical protein SNEBB_005090 [Seison nebaliae]